MSHVYLWVEQSHSSRAHRTCTIAFATALFISTVTMPFTELTMLPEYLRPHYERLGVRELRPDQIEALRHIQSGNDCFVSLPTGSGKSLIYQLAPFLPRTADGRSQVIVVMPLVSLIQQQVSKLCSAGFDAAVAHSYESSLQCLRSRTQFILMSPETLAGMFMRAADADRSAVDAIQYVFIDESHCVTKWGQSDKRSQAFRSKFSLIGEFRSICPQAIYVAMTATATKTTEEEVCRLLQMPNYKVIRQSPEKNNLRYSVVTTKGDMEQCFSWLVDEFDKGKRPKTLIFFKNLHQLGEAFNYLVGRCPAKSIAMYHSRVTEETKRQLVSNFSKQGCTEPTAILCSSAFSMGLDIPDIRRVIHFGVPPEMDEYLQETGRAGRDGEYSLAIIIRHDGTLSGGNISSGMKEYLISTDCRKVALLLCFGVAPITSGSFMCCDNCTKRIPCCSCGLEPTCDHIDQKCYCVKLCSILPRIGDTDASTYCTSNPVQVRASLDDDSRKALEYSLFQLKNEAKFVPSNINTIYPQLVENIISNFTTINSVDSIVQLGAYSTADAERIMEIITSFEHLLVSGS